MVEWKHPGALNDLSGVGVADNDSDDDGESSRRWKKYTDNGHKSGEIGNSDDGDSPDDTATDDTLILHHIFQHKADVTLYRAQGLPHEGFSYRG